MKRFFIALAMIALGLGAVSCYNDDKLWDEIDSLKSRMTALERAYGELTDYKTIMSNMMAIQSVTPNADGSFTITFYGGIDPITISNGAAGREGDKGENGVTPKFKIEEGVWYVSYDEGATWEALGEASTNTLFQNAYITDNGEFFVIILLDGTEVRIPLKAPGEGGGPGSGQEGDKVSFSDWVGDWYLADRAAAISENVNGESLVLKSDYIELSLKYNEDGTVSLVFPGYGGWVGTDSEGNYYYAYAYSGSDYVSLSEGDVVCTWTLSDDKSSAVISYPSKYDYLGIGSYSSDDSWRGYVSHFGESSILANLTKTASGDGGGSAAAVDINWTVDTSLRALLYSGYYYHYSVGAGFVTYLSVPASGISTSDAAAVKKLLDGYAGDFIEYYKTNEWSPYHGYLAQNVPYAVFDTVGYGPYPAYTTTETASDGNYTFFIIEVGADHIPTGNYNAGSASF